MGERGVGSPAVVVPVQQDLPQPEGVRRCEQRGNYAGFGRRFAVARQSSRGPRLPGATSQVNRIDSRGDAWFTSQKLELVPPLDAMIGTRQEVQIARREARLDSEAKGGGQSSERGKGKSKEKGGKGKDKGKGKAKEAEGKKSSSAEGLQKDMSPPGGRQG